MVKLNKIYTQPGRRRNHLVNGMRVPKHARRPSAFGEVDEANSVIGLVRLHTKTISHADEMLSRIQNDLFDLGQILPPRKPINPPYVLPLSK